LQLESFGCRTFLQLVAQHTIVFQIPFVHLQSMSQRDNVSPATGRIPPVLA
jgi:hypothetical protein